MKKEDCELSFPKYQALLSIDLRCFDLRQPDYGVRQYFETLGFLPHILMYLGLIAKNSKPDDAGYQKQVQ